MAARKQAAPLAPTKTTLIAVTGDESFLRRREVRKAVSTQSKNGWRIESADGEIPGSLDSAMTQNPFVGEGSDKLLVIVQNPDKVDIEILRDHWANGDGDTVLIMEYDGNPSKATKFGKLCDELAKNHRSFPALPEYKRGPVAVDFCRDEARARGYTLPAELAEGIVNPRVCGTDLGVLSFEVQKICMLAHLDGVTEIGPKQVQGAIAPMNETPATEVQDALLKKQKDRLVRALNRVKKTSHDDPIMLLLRVLGNSATTGLIIADALKRKASVSDIVDQLSTGEKKMNAWMVENILIPPVRKWKVSEFAKLIRALAEVERAVLNGAISPWVTLCIRLMEVCG
jgi:DNA polymerase III delta subunit